MRTQNTFSINRSSTPCLNVLKGCRGATIEDLQRTKVARFPRATMFTKVGFSHPRVIEAIVTARCKELSFCTRRYTNIPAIELAKKLAELRPEI
jgi:4-aminobutyrate aminotransferase